jgi:hypothetical protein
MKRSTGPEPGTLMTRTFTAAKRGTPRPTGGTPPDRTALVLDD